MYKKQRPNKTTINRNESYIGETIEQKVRRLVNNKEPIKDRAAQIYTERKDGVPPETDIRTDRFEYAVDARDKIVRDHIARRDNAGKRDIGAEAKENMAKEGEGKPAGSETGGNKSDKPSQ